MLREVLARIGSGYPAARREPLAKHPLARFIREDAASAVRTTLGEMSGGMLVKGSPGQGIFAEVPWISVFDPVVTRTATSGYYVVYLFSEDCIRIYLSINQGTTAIHDEHGARYLAVLSERAQFMRTRLAGYAVRLHAEPINLAATGTLPKGYEAGHALGTSYNLRNLPSDEQLADDLREAVRAYLALTYLGGLEPSLEPNVVLAEFKGDFSQSSTTLEEARRYRMHMRLERNAQAAKLANLHHGRRCQACTLDFSEAYGELERHPSSLNPHFPDAVACS